MDIENNQFTTKEKHLLQNALEFFVDYKFSTGKWMNSEYIKRIEQVNHNDYAKLCESMGGKTRFAPTLGNQK